MKLLRNNPKIYRTIDGDMVVTRLLRNNLRVSIDGIDSISHKGKDSRKLQRKIGKIVRSKQGVDKIWELFNLGLGESTISSHHVRSYYKVTVSYCDDVIVITYTTSKSQTEYIFSGPGSWEVMIGIEELMNDDHLQKVGYDLEPYLNWLVSNWTDR